MSSPGRSPDNEYLGCSHALAKGGTKRLMDEIDEIIQQHGGWS